MSGVGNVTGADDGNDYDYGTFFSYLNGSATMQGYIAELLIFDSALSDGDIAILQSHYATKFGAV